MEIDFEELRQVFLTESESMLNTMEEALIVLEARPDDEETLFDIFRAVHTLKGSAGCLGLKSAPEFAHIIEDLLQRMHTHTVAVTHDLVTVLLRSVDALRQMMAVADDSGLLAEYQALIDHLAEAAEAASSRAPLPADGGESAAKIWQTPASAAEPVTTSQASNQRQDKQAELVDEAILTAKRAVEKNALPAAQLKPSAASRAKAIAECAQYLTFFMGEEEYGIPILHVREILEYDTLTKVPATPPWIRGVINLRGQAIPVVDLAVKLGLAESAISRWTCIVTVETELDGECVAMGVMADRVSQVMELQAKDVAMPPAFGTRLRADYLLGMGRVDKRFVLLLDIDQVLSTDEMLSLAMAGEGAMPEAALCLQ